MSYTFSATRKSSANPAWTRWVKTYRIVLAAAAYIAVVALITLAQVASDQLAGDANAPFAPSDSQAF